MTKTIFDAIELVAEQLASFRSGMDVENPYEYNEADKLEAGHIVGVLCANGFLDCGFGIVGCAVAFQAAEAGSIPAARSKTLRR